MMILTNGLTDVVDEGFLKVANSLVKRIVQDNSGTMVVTYDRKSNMENLHLHLNKLLLNKKLFKTIRKANEPILYIPFPAKEWATALRVFILSLVCKKRVTVLFTMFCRCGFIGQLLFKLSGAHIVTLSKSTLPFYNKMVGEKRVSYLKTGVDTERFSPVSKEKKIELKKTYGFDPAKPVILHVGHLKYGRNVSQLMKLDSRYQAVFVASTLTKSEQDELLRQELLQCPNIKIIDEYQPNIQEIYQLSDVYFFPVVAEGNCIDIPLSCMEAAACNKPVVTTPYGEMVSFQGKDGFWFVDSFEAANLNQIIASALASEKVNSREQVLEYDWKNAVAYFSNIE